MHHVAQKLITIGCPSFSNSDVLIIPPSNVFISIDTFYSDVASRCIELGVHMINDISGGRFDPKILKVLANSNKFYVISHSRGNSQTMDGLTNYNNLIEDILSKLLQRTESAIDYGINPKNIIWDPGLGFAKDNDKNLILIKNIELI